MTASLEARQLVERIRSDLKPLEQSILRHAYLDALEAGRVDRATLRAFAGQQYHIITSDLRSIALVVSRQGMLPSRTFFMNALHGEARALEALHSFAGALGMNVTDLEAFEPLQAAHAYCAFVAQLALYGSDAELAGAFLVNLAAWGANCGRMSRALRAKYGFAESQVAFFELFANLPAIEAEATAVIQGGLDHGISPRLIHRAARMLQGYELMYWDAMADVAGVEGRS